MGLITKEIEIKWSTNNKNRYVDKGYSFTEYGNKFTVKIDDLLTGSNVDVVCKCDRCSSDFHVLYNEYNKKRKNQIGNCTCPKCTKLNHSLSFQEWCYNNLSKNDADQIIFDRWDYKLNKCSPNEVTHCSLGATGKGYWFKCLDNSAHKSELKYLGNIINRLSALNCNQCKSIFNTHNHLVKYFVNIDDAYKYSFSSGKKVLLKCQDCGFIRDYIIADFARQGFYCNRCSDGVSYPEKFMISVFEQINTNFITQYSRKNAEWCNKYRYDFYLPDSNVVVEVHGEQHYINDNWYASHKDTQKIDEDKYKIAIKNGVNYISIDARKSDLDWIENSIMNSKLSSLIDLSCIDWKLCDKQASSSLLIKACDLWSSGITSTKTISDILCYCQTTIIKYLKKGASLGLCDYCVDEVIKFHRKVICLNTSKIFSSIKEASLYYINCQPQAISRACKGTQSVAGRHPVTKEKLKWMYYEDYVNNNIGNAS